MATERLSQVTGHMTSTFPRGLLADQTAIVTGAGQGIGAETALLFAKEGARVVVADLDGTKAREVAARIAAGGGKAIAVAGDIMLSETIDAVVNAAVELGGGKIHHIVNNVSFFFLFLFPSLGGGGDCGKEGKEGREGSGLTEDETDRPDSLGTEPYTRSRINSGTPSWTCTLRLRSASSARRHRTSASRTARPAASPTSRPPAGSTGMRTPSLSRSFRLGGGWD